MSGPFGSYRLPPPPTSFFSQPSSTFSQPSSIFSSPPSFFGPPSDSFSAPRVPFGHSTFSFPSSMIKTKFTLHVIGNSLQQCELRPKVAGTHTLHIPHQDSCYSGKVLQSAISTILSSYDTQLDPTKYDVLHRKDYLCTRDGRDIYSYYTSSSDMCFGAINGYDVEVYDTTDTTSPAQTFMRRDMSYPVKLQIHCEGWASEKPDVFQQPDQSTYKRIEFAVPLATPMCLAALRKTITSVVTEELLKVEGIDNVSDVICKIDSGFRTQYAASSFDSEVWACLQRYRPFHVRYIRKLDAAAPVASLSKEVFAHKVSAVATAAAAVLDGQDPSKIDKEWARREMYQDAKPTVPSHLSQDDAPAVLEWFESQMKNLREQWAGVAPAASSTTSPSNATGGATAVVTAERIPCAAPGSVLPKVDTANRKKAEPLKVRIPGLDVLHAWEASASALHGTVSQAPSQTAEKAKERSSEKAKKRSAEKVHERSAEMSAERPTLAVHGATCNVCELVIKGKRYKCLACPDYDCCSDCKPDMPDLHPNHRFVTLSAADLMPEGTQPANWEYHTGVVCDGCDKYVLGPRFKCVVCDDFDYCAACEANPLHQHVGAKSDKPHLFLKIDKPLPRWVKVTDYLPLQRSMDKAIAETKAKEMKKTVPAKGPACSSQSPAKGDGPAHESVDIGMESVASPLEASPAPAAPVVAALESKDAEKMPADEVKALVEKVAAANHNQPSSWESSTSPPAQSVVTPPAQTVTTPSARTVKPAAATASLYMHDESLELYDMEFFSDANLQDGSEIAAGTDFVKMWRVINNGRRAWPAGTTIVPVCSSSNTEEGKAREVQSILPFALPGLVSSATLRAPDRHGPWNIYFRLERPVNPDDPHSERVRFGQQLWCSLSVVSGNDRRNATGDDCESQRMAEHEDDAGMASHGSSFFEPPHAEGSPETREEEATATYGSHGWEDVAPSERESSEERRSPSAMPTQNRNIDTSAYSEAEADDTDDLYSSSDCAVTEDDGDDSDYELVEPSSASASD